MRNFQKLVAVFVLSGLCVAAPSDSGKKHHKKAEAKETCSEELRQLKDQVAQQQAATQQLQQQLQQTQQQLQQTQQQVSGAQATAQAAEAKATTVETNTNLQVQKVQSDLADVKAAMASTEATVKAMDKRVDALEHPLTIAYKGVRITPGGFFDLTSVFRQRATNSGPATPFNAIPLETATTNGVGGLTEFSATARGSRISLRMDGDAGSNKLAGYFETDFYGNTFATPNQTTAYGLRIRQAWGRVQTAGGFSATFGQMWNLMTMNRNAADADAVWIPNTLDTNYLVGFDWGRQAELRLAKTWNKKVTFALGITDPSYLNLGVTNTSTQVVGLAGSGAGNLGNTYTSTCATTTTAAGAVSATCTYGDTYSTNLAPDVLLKLSFDSPKLGHIEIKGLQRSFRDKVTATAATPAHTNTEFGGGVGAGFVLHLIPKKVDLVAQGLVGKGISRYQDSGQYDFVVRTNSVANGVITTTGGDNNIQNIKSYSAIVGLETHPGKRMEFNLWGGTEHYGRSTYEVTNLTTGVVSTLGYGAENGVNNKDVIEGSAALWYDILKGNYGTVRWGAQYAYVTRTTWQVNGGFAPKGINNIGFLGARYIIP